MVCNNPLLLKLSVYSNRQAGGSGPVVSNLEQLNLNGISLDKLEEGHLAKAASSLALVPDTNKTG
jgi:hypothetical protein